MGGNVRVAETTQSKLNVGHKINCQGCKDITTRKSAAIAWFLDLNQLSDPEPSLRRDPVTPQQMHAASGSPQYSTREIQHQLG